jgi:3-phosphoshikimate 1-carboxyvinyltransferase
LARRGRAPFFARVRPPGSKSLTNRALLLGALASGDSTLRRALVGADDAERMIAAVSALGARVAAEGETIRISGVGGRWKPGSGGGVSLDLHNAGTATRFLAAAAALSPAPVQIDGNARMRERPIGELIEALSHLGVRAEFMGRDGFPPVRLHPPGVLPGGLTLTLGTTLSSQFVSALLLIAPFLPGGLTLRLEGEITSPTYIQMTLGLLDALGATVRTSDSLAVVRVAGAGAGGLAGFEYSVEPDASGATYFWTAAAIVPGATCRIEGLDSRSLQGDARFPELLARMGATVIRDEPGAGGGALPTAIGIRGPAALAPIMADLAPMPDAAMSLAVAASFASGRSILRGLRTLRVKETDRIAALHTELAKAGVKVDTNVLGDRDAVTINPPLGGIACPPDAGPIEFDTYDDHRMAMSLALIGLRRPNVLIRNPACVAKTYPAFWRDLASLAG